MEHTIQNIGKKRRKKFVKKFHKPNKKPTTTTTTTHSRYESKYISSKRLTRKIGIYNKGKISDLVSRRYECSSPQMKARVQEDLHKILSQCEREKIMSDTDEIVKVPCSTKVQEAKVSTPFPHRRKTKPRKITVSSTSSSSSSEDTKDCVKRPKKPVLNSFKIFTAKVTEKPVEQKCLKRKRTISTSPCYDQHIKKKCQEKIRSTSSSSSPMSSPNIIPVENIQGKKKNSVNSLQHLPSSENIDSESIENIPSKNFHNKTMIRVPDSNVVHHYIKIWSSLLEKKLQFIPYEPAIKMISQEQTGESLNAVSRKFDVCCQTSDLSSSSSLHCMSDSEDIESGKSSELTSSFDLRTSSSLKGQDLFSPSLFSKCNIGNDDAMVHSSDELLNNVPFKSESYQKLEVVRNDDFLLTEGVAGPSTLNLSSESSDALFSSSPLKPPSEKLDSPKRFFRYKLY